MCFDLSDEKRMLWSIFIGSCANMRYPQPLWGIPDRTFQDLCVVCMSSALSIELSEFLFFLPWFESLVPWLPSVVEYAKLLFKFPCFVMLTTAQSGPDIPSEVHWLPIPKMAEACFYKKFRYICAQFWSPWLLKLVQNNTQQSYHPILPNSIEIEWKEVALSGNPREGSTELWFSRQNLRRWEMIMLGNGRTFICLLSWDKTVKIRPKNSPELKLWSDPVPS